jgi:ubiquinone/menaquinone biosynthesis C-methylase UbiE
MKTKTHKSIIIVQLSLLMNINFAFAQEADVSFSKPSKAEVFWHSFMSRTIWASFYEDYFNQISFKGNETVLDFGCGWGTEAKIMAKKLNKGGQLSCLDISPEWIAESKEVLKGFKNVDFYLGDITQMNIPENSFDIVVIHIVLHDINVELREGIINSIAKVLKPGGQLYIREPLMADRQISANNIEILMNKAMLHKTSIKFTNSLIMGKLVEMVFEKNE